MSDITRSVYHYLKYQVTLFFFTGAARNNCERRVTERLLTLLTFKLQHRVVSEVHGG